MVRAAGDFPADRGVAAMLLLRHAVLAPGQAMFMPAGGLHAYLQGTGIELLANSDNVVRAGLTGKHIDVPELLKLVDPAVAVPVLSAAPVPPASGSPASGSPASGSSAPGSPAPGDGRVRWFDTPASEFRLFVADLTDELVALPGRGPRIALCTSGSAALLSGRDEIKLARGESCFISAADGPLGASGSGRLFLAAPGISPAP